jgi:hypothetical protein
MPARRRELHIANDDTGVAVEGAPELIQSGSATMIRHVQAQTLPNRAGGLFGHASSPWGVESSEFVAALRHTSEVHQRPRR